MNLLIVFIIVIQGIIIFTLFRIIRFHKDRTEKEIDKVQKGLEFYDILVRWLKLRQEHRVLAEYFR